MFPHGMWQGERCFILGGGASLTAEIAESVRGHGKVMVINSTARLAPWADALYFHDYPWFRDHRPIVDNFAGKVFTSSRRAYSFKTRSHKFWAQPPTIQSKPLSSGHYATDVVLALGCKVIVLLGMDCRNIEGRSHNHNDYEDPKGLTHPIFLPMWDEYPARAAAWGATIINATPGSAIAVFPQISLDRVIGDDDESSPETNSAPASGIAGAGNSVRFCVSPDRPLPGPVTSTPTEGAA